MTLYAGKSSEEVLDYLLRRRSAKLDLLDAPGPSPQQLQIILQAAMRTPDHGRMFPWYFIVFEGEGREEMGHIIAQAFARNNPEASAEKIEIERARFMRAPVVVAVVSRMRKGKKPLWEQILSAGAVCMNLSLAAHASGFGVNWLTEWYAFDEYVRDAIGLDARDHIAGFLYIGTVTGEVEERPRPDPDLIINHFTPGGLLKKGDEYDQEKFGFPDACFSVDDLKLS